MRVRLAMGLGVVLAAMLFGCQDLTGIYTSDDGQILPEPAGQGLVADRSSPIPDLPIPVGFVVVRSQSNNYVTEGVRVVNHVYQGRATIGDTVKFYRRVAGENNWQPAGEHMQGGNVLMLFVKGREQLEVDITPRRKVTTAVIRIRARTTGVQPAKP